MVKRYSKIWLMMIGNSIQVSFASKFGAVLFIVAKLLRFGFFLLTLVFLTQQTQLLAGYSREHIFLFFLTFTVVDTTSQLLFREVYRFRPRVVSGDFDLDLIKPFHSLFRPLLGGVDIFDFVTLIPYIGALIYVGMQFQPSLLSVFLYVLLLCNALVIAMAFHILVLALGILTTEIDHAIQIYRDVSGMGRFPIDIYGKNLQGFLMFIIPVGIMVTVPVQLLVGISKYAQFTGFLCIIGPVFLCISIVVWKQALQRYASASS